MLRLLIKDITVEISQPRQLVAHIRWQGGSCTEVGVQLPPHRADAVRYPAAVVDRVRHLAQSLLDAQIVDQLNQEGLLSALGKPFTVHMIRWIRHHHEIPAAQMKQPEELTVTLMSRNYERCVTHTGSRRHPKGLLRRLHCETTVVCLSESTTSYSLS